MAQDDFHAWLLDASKELDTAKETIYWASSTPAGPGLLRLMYWRLTTATEKWKLDWS